jgi:hypothetical protein
MTHYIVKDNQVHFRQGYARPVLCSLFVALHALGVTVGDTGSRVYPHSVEISESEFLSVIEMIGG